MSDKNDKSVEVLNNKFRRLAQKLVRTGPILQGTIIERKIKGRKDKKQIQGQTYGPYYQWTFKQEGKSVTVNLTKEQVKNYQQAIDNNKKMMENLKEMRDISRQILAAKTKGVKKRKVEK